jgi:hypothetical protein
MNKSALVLVFLVTIFQFSCHHKVPTTSLPADVKALIFDTTADLADTDASYDVDSIFIRDQILTVTVSYSGGCAPHSFNLYYNGKPESADLRSVKLRLYHKTKDETCRELVTEQHRFDLSDLKVQSGTVLIIKDKQCLSKK